MKDRSLLSASLSENHVSPTQQTVSIGFGLLVFVLVFSVCICLCFGWLIPTSFPVYTLDQAIYLTSTTVKEQLFLQAPTALNWSQWFSLISEGEQHKFKTLAYGSLLLSAVMAFFIAVKALIATKGSDQIQLAGAELLEGKPAVTRLKKFFKAEYKTFGQGVLIYPKLGLPAHREKQGCLIVGQVGSGKTQIMLAMIQEALASQSKSIIYDIKGDFTSYYADENQVALLAPWDQRSIHWAIAKDIKTEFQAELFAEALITSNQQDPMWAISARLILTGCIVVLLKTKGDQWGWQSLADLLDKPTEILKAKLDKHYPQAAKLVDPKSKTSQSMLLTLYSQAKPIYQLATAWGNAQDGISLIGWTKSETPKQSTLIIQSHTDYSDLSQSIADIALFFISQTLLGMPDSRDRSLYFFLDEAAQLKFSNLPKLLSLGRSKGAKLFLGLQDLSLLRKHFTQDEITGISSMIASLVVLRVSGVGDTITQLSKALGNKQVERLTNTFDYKGGNSFSWQSQTIPVVTEADITQLPQASKKGVTGYLSLAGTNIVAKLIWPLQKIESVAPAVVWAGWTKLDNKSPESMKLAEVESALNDAFLDGGDDA
jgi:type IV secretory pathway TraG/TraD family ATPase VirD4